MELAAIPSLWVCRGKVICNAISYLDPVSIPFPFSATCSDRISCALQEGVWGSAGTALLLLNISTKYCNGQFLSQEASSATHSRPLARKIISPSPPSRIEPRFVGGPACYLDTTLTELSRLSKTWTAIWSSDDIVGVSRGSTCSLWDLLPFISVSASLCFNCALK